MFSQEKSVVRVDDEKSVLPHVMLIHLVQKPSQLGVAHGQEGAVLFSQPADLFLRVLIFHWSVGREIKGVMGISAVIKLPVLIRDKKRFVRIKTLDL